MLVSDAPCAWWRCGAGEGGAEMLEFGPRWQEVDREDIEAEVDGCAVGLRKPMNIGGGHLAEHVLLGAVDRRLRRG